MLAHVDKEKLSLETVLVFDERQCILAHCCHKVIGFGFGKGDGDKSPALGPPPPRRSLVSWCRVRRCAPGRIDIAYMWNKVNRNLSRGIILLRVVLDLRIAMQTLPNQRNCVNSCRG